MQCSYDNATLLITLFSPLFPSHSFCLYCTEQKCVKSVRKTWAFWYCDSWCLKVSFSLYSCDYLTLPPYFFYRIKKKKMFLVQFNSCVCVCVSFFLISKWHKSYQLPNSKLRSFSLLLKLLKLFKIHGGHILIKYLKDLGKKSALYGRSIVTHINFLQQ